MNAPSSAPMLEMRNVIVDFDGFKATNDLSLTIESGSMTVVIGPNGAGKSTMCDAIIGRVRPTSGKVLFHGREIQSLPEHSVVGLGICRKFQTPGVLVALTVFENLTISATTDKRWWTKFSRKGEAEAFAKAEEVLAKIGLEARRDVPAGDLSHGEKQWLEIGMVVATDAELLLLDEPTAGMGAAESTATADLIKSLLGKHAVLVIDHDIDFVAQLGGHVVVLHQGKLLREGTLAEIRADEEVAAIYLGRAK
jgi:urea transport system ATP-binding protein